MRAMNARMTNRIETGAEFAAAAILAGAVGFAVLGAFAGDPRRLVFGAGAAAAAYVLGFWIMKAAGGQRSRFTIRIFDVRSLEHFETGELQLTEQLNGELVLTDSDRLGGELTDFDQRGSELLLTNADRLEEHTAGMPETLVLDDVLAAVGSDSRVVRLFDRKAMPTPGQMSSSIDRHLNRGGSSAHPDAAQALSDALAELRRSLR